MTGPREDLTAAVRAALDDALARRLAAAAERRTARRALRTRLQKNRDAGLRRRHARKAQR